jgi:peptidoglycan/LPS O-acetylase OafA/YrhL
VIVVGTGYCWLTINLKKGHSLGECALEELTTRAYRSDIDGLRAIAVLLVVAYHVKTRLSHGGFIGVDVFFVISGFLITSIIVRDLEKSRFTITGFYVRRVQRIVPALIGVLIATSITAYFFLLPSELKDYSRSLLAAIFSGSNLYFWDQTGYFNSQSSTMPLLHTWSLAVEEQFYILFPAFLALLYRRCRTRVFLVLSVLGLASFVLSARTAYTNPSFAFYWPVTRAWELLCGSILALVEIPGMKNRWLRNAAAMAGLILICFAATSYNAYTPFPGIAALAPCLGAGLIIGAGSAGKTLVGRFLSIRPLVFIGLISYSLYLWHWPVLVFQSMGMSIDGLSVTTQKLFAFGVSFLLATLSWRFIESPFRGNPRSVSPAKMFQVAALCASVPALAGCAFLLLHGVPSRFPANAITVASYLDNSATQSRYRTGTCFLTEAYSFQKFDQSVCLHESSTLPNYLIFGDSHAAQLEYGLSSVFPNVNFMQATASGCKPTLVQEVRLAPQCVKLVDFILRDYLPRSHVKVVLFAGHWRASDLDNIYPTIQYIRSLGITPVIWGPVVEYDASLPRLLAMSIEKTDSGLAQRHRLVTVSDLDHQMAELARNQWHVKYFSYFDALCKNGECQEYGAPEVPLQEDTTHLTESGSILVAERFKEGKILP